MRSLEQWLVLTALAATYDVSLRVEGAQILRHAVAVALLVLVSELIWRGWCLFDERRHERAL